MDEPAQIKFEQRTDEMVIAKVRVTSVSAETVFSTHIPKGAIGCKVAFEFTDPEWNGLRKTAVFRNSRQTLDSVLEDDCAVIPHELLSRVKDAVYVGIYGTDGGQNLAIPTVWAKLGEVDSAANPSGDEATDPTLPYWAQVLDEVEALRELIFEPADLEELLNEAKESGEFDGPQGEKGDQGEPGYSPVKGVDYWTAEDKSEVVTEAAHTVLAMEYKSSEILCNVSGKTFSAADASDRELASLQIFGRSTQNGTPTPDNPVIPDSVGDGGSISVMIGTSASDENPQVLTAALGNCLRGIPVVVNGTYVDENGQNWICDEVDFKKGVRIQRVGVHTTTSSDKWYTNGANSGVGTKNLHVFTSCVSSTINRERRGTLCDKFTYYSSTGTGNESRSNVCTNFAGQGNIIFDVDLSIASTLDAWKSYVAENPLTIYYILATPVETALSDTELSAYAALHTNCPNTAGYNDADAHMDVTYVADTKTYIDNKFASLLAAQSSAE